MSDSRNESAQPTFSGTKDLFTSSSPFYPGPTTFGGSAAITRVDDNFKRIRILASEINEKMEQPTNSESTESRIMKRRRLYAFLNRNEITYRKYRNIQNESRMGIIHEMEETQMPETTNRKTPVVRTFYFSEPIPLMQHHSKRDFVFSEPTPLD
ncbi:uncharacterized protein LOC6735324 [Drosophila simulans]|uniref:GD11486 n=1 Tax=Drosophila simulans TaxID=7240 RepID=B4QEI6_DROSI|nr:uncharacterized protein LOC6735324 [Drosophila simulans]EDX07860.1 GD11486 [Drosophila simulans]KMY95202.1 uncharacterized protein Dsimw501_GD11486 [Drosophila simulans]